MRSRAEHARRKPPSRRRRKAIEGTRVIDELRLALENVYKILEIHEIHEYRVTQNNPKTGKGGFFLKLKAEASGYPSWVGTSSDEDRFIEMFWQSDKDKIKYNAAKRGLANVCLTFRNRASYIGRAHRYPPNTPFYIFFQQINVLNFLNMLHTLLFSLQNPDYFIMLPFLFLYYSHFTYRCANI